MDLTGAIHLGMPPALAKIVGSEVVQSAARAAGTAISTATALTGDICLVTSCHASVNDGVQLRSPSRGAQQVVINRSGSGANGASILKVYPPTGGRINEGTVNAALSIPANSTTAEVFYAVNSLDYYNLNH